MALQSWDTQVSRAAKVFDSLNDEQLWQEIAPGRNRGVYLLGHLIVVNDGLFKFFGLGDRLHADWDDAFLRNPDKAGLDFPSTPVLRQAWIDVHAKLAEQFKSISADSWFQRHQSMTDEDFTKDPARNKLSVLLNRTAHIAYHLGQVALIKK
ncbi:MAG: DinB family protein [Chitinophagaceae bacterium]|nr:DinB family protein [Chitinophagaceae bacterium]